jgi:hypothetical protein
MKQQEKAVRELSDQEKQDADNIRQMVAERDKLNKALAENQRYYREEKQVKKDEVAATKASIKELEKQVKAYKTLQGTGGTMVKQLRAMREELQRMEDAGQFGTKAFMDLSIAAGRLEDQIGDTQARIRVLSSDTIGLDTAMGVADGLSGAFYVATSAAEVFGSDLEALQEAFYRVQAAMSVVSGIQQIANTLNKDSVVSIMALTAAMKLKQKAEARAAATTAADTVATGAQTAATGAATTAQWSLNAAIAANPLAWLIAIIVAAVAAVAALGVGVYALVKSFTAAGKAQNDFKEASKELENIQRENAVGQATRAQQQQELLRKQADAQEEELRKAEARNASEVEIAQISLRHAKEKHDAVAKYNDDEIKRNQKEVDKLAEMVDAKQREVAAYRDGGKKQKKAMEELAEVEQQYADALQKTADLETEKQDAWEAQQEAAKALEQARKQMRLDAEQANIDLMREGAAKEIAQIKAGGNGLVNINMGANGETPVDTAQMGLDTLQDIADRDSVGAWTRFRKGLKLTSDQEERDLGAISSSIAAIAPEAISKLKAAGVSGINTMAEFLTYLGLPENPTSQEIAGALPQISAIIGKSGATTAQQTPVNYKDKYGLR